MHGRIFIEEWMPDTLGSNWEKNLVYEFNWEMFGKDDCLDFFTESVAPIFSWRLILCDLNMRAYKSQINLSKRGIKSSTYTLHIATWC